MKAFAVLFGAVGLLLVGCSVLGTTPWPQAPLDAWERIVSLIVGGTALANGVAIWRDSEE